MKRGLKSLLLSALVAVAGVANAEDIRINGAGSTFVAPLMQKWAADYQKAHPNIKIDYQGKGSGEGIKGVTDKTLDFGATDAPMSAKEIEAAGGNVINVPVVAGAVVPVYNIPGVSGDLKLDGVVLADIYQGKIKKWNDARIVATNPDAKLPDLGILLAVRSDGSGTTFVFASYLASQSDEFLEKVGANKLPNWPAGQAGKGNAGVAAIVEGTPGAMGYVELNFAIENKLSYAQVKNAEGEFVKATPESTSLAGIAAAAGMKPGSLVARLWNQKGKGVYPICGLVYVMIRTDLGYFKDEAKAKALVDFLQWATHDGQATAGPLSYAPLTEALQGKVAEALSKITTK